MNEEVRQSFAVVGDVLEKLFRLVSLDFLKAAFLLFNRDSFN